MLDKRNIRMPHATVLATLTMLAGCSTGDLSPAGEPRLGVAEGRDAVEAPPPSSAPLEADIQDELKTIAEVRASLDDLESEVRCMLAEQQGGLQRTPAEHEESRRHERQILDDVQVELDELRKMNDLERDLGSRSSSPMYGDSPESGFEPPRMGSW